jgi:hypothetical protein
MLTTVNSRSQIHKLEYNKGYKKGTVFAEFRRRKTNYG